MRCPVCRAEVEQGPQCRRCRADLALLFALEAQREQALSAARIALYAGRWSEAELWVVRAAVVRQDGDTQQLRAILHLLQRRYAQAAAWRQSAAEPFSDEPLDFGSALMTVPPTDRETILLVDDEEPVRRTFQEWLESANLDCHILTAGDAEAALVHANRQTIDLAILDWNLGAGNDGLHLLEDLYLFNADVVAILVTGFAHQATPLDAMRMGVRDYLDKNHDLDRNTFLASVRKQLDRIRPARRERRLHQGLVTFREAVEKIIPLVQSAAALNDPVPLPQAIGSLFQFLLHSTGATDGVLLVHCFDEHRRPAEVYRAYDSNGNVLPVTLVPFARSIAAGVVSQQEPCLMLRLDEAGTSGAIELQPFERGRRNLLAAALTIGPGKHAVFELFDKRGADRFSEADGRLVAAASALGGDLLRQDLADRQTSQVLLDAVAAALKASETVTHTLQGSASQRLEEPPPAAVLERLREGFRAAPGGAVEAVDTVELAEAIRVLAVRHGPPAVRHCIQLAESLRRLLDSVTGTGEARP